MKGTGQCHQRTDLFTAPVQISLEIMKEEIRIPVCVLNVTDKPIRVYREQSVTTFQPLPGSGKVGHAVKAATTEGTHTA